MGNIQLQTYDVHQCMGHDMCVRDIDYKYDHQSRKNYGRGAPGRLTRDMSILQTIQTIFISR